VRTAAVALLRVVGRSVGFIIPVDSLDSGLDAIPPDDITSGGLPAVRAAVADSVARAAELTMARRLRVPMPALQVGAEWGDPSQPGALSVIGLAVPLPIWNQNGGAVMEARAQADRAAAQVEETRLDAWQQIASTRAHLEETVRRARLARDSLVPLAARLRDRALRGYAVGETDIRAALDALRSERQVRLEALQDQLAFQQALADWFLLAGGTQ
jgi:cobalt-zinc-cadmium efflux system outer membrane protein